MPSYRLSFTQLFGFPCTCPVTSRQCPTLFLSPVMLEREGLPPLSLYVHWMLHGPLLWFFLPSCQILASTAKNKKMEWVKGFGMSEKQRWGMWWQREQNWEVWGNGKEQEAKTSGGSVRLKYFVLLNLQHFQDRGPSKFQTTLFLSGYYKPINRKCVLVINKGQEKGNRNTAWECKQEQTRVMFCAILAQE